MLCGLLLGDKLRQAVKLRIGVQQASALVLGRDKLRMLKPQPLDGECIGDCDHRGLWHREADLCYGVPFFDDPEGYQRGKTRS